MRFRKKPVVVEAMQWDGTNHAAIKEWGAPIGDPKEPNYLRVVTLEDGPEGMQGRALHVADKGDWIIKGVKGEFYPCKPDIFATTYEAVGEEKQ